MAEEMVMDEVAAPEVDETPVESSEFGEEAEAEPVEGAEETEGAEDEAGDEQEGEEEPVEGQQPAQDDRKMPDGLKKAIKAIKATDPVTSKKIKELYWSDQEYRVAFPKPEDAVAAKNLIEEIGGQEGIQEIAAEREEWQNFWGGLDEGKPETISALAEKNPDGFLKAAPHVINEWAKRASEQYGYFQNKVAFNTLTQDSAILSGLQTLQQAHSMLSESPWLQKAIGDVINGIVGLNDKAAQFEQKRTDPREEQLKQREQEFETKRRADFETNVAGQAEKFLSEKMQPEIDRIIGNRKVDPEAMKEFQAMVQRKVGELLAGIPGIAEKLEAYYRTGDSAKSVAYIQSQYNRLLPQAAKTIEPFLRNISPATPARTANKPANGQRQPSEPGTIVLKEMPEWHQLDPAWRSRPESTAELMEGRAVLANGKRATGWA